MTISYKECFFQPRLAAKRAKTSPGGPAPKKPAVKPACDQGRGCRGGRGAIASRSSSPAGPMIPAPAYPISQGVPRTKAQDAVLLASFIE